jgi:hypothetical protein
MKRLLTLALLFAFFAPILRGQDKGKKFDDKFRQLEEILPTPNSYRTGSGAPGHEYWQQQADYKMKLTLDDEKQQIFGEETITYINNSPDALTYLWLQLDQNNFDKKGIATAIDQQKMSEKLTAGQLAAFDPQNDYGCKVDWVKDATDRALPYTIVETMMRVDLPKAMKKGERFVFKIKWMFTIVDRLKTGARSGWEYFPEENNYLYCIAQHFPRMCVYSDVTGWQTKQFLGAGEFTLTFGNYDVSITAPADHIVGATGVLTNPQQCLTAAQIERFNRSKTAYTDPVIIVTEAEAREAEKTKSKTTKTWNFKAENVRDVAFCSSRKFIWDAMAVKQEDGTTPLAMS